MKFNPPAHPPIAHPANAFSQQALSPALLRQKAEVCLPRAPIKAGEFFSNRKDLPIRGRAQGGDDGSLIIEEHPLDWTYRPADLQGVHGAFAVFVTGDSMEPKYKNQDIAYIHPTLTVRRGRYVLIETTQHAGFIKQFDRWAGDMLHIKQHNPEKTITIPREKVRRIMMVIGSLDA